MSDTTVAAATGAMAAGGDERLAYRGVFQRLFIRPEIGAMIGAVGIWVFFWAVSVPFGTVNGASGIIDTASILGIMAVAVSVLMVGGEFDLSSGANTGAMGMLVILLSKEAGEFGGAGLNLWIAVPLSLVIALGIGFFNGWMVESTKLPSFIVTLGTFFVLRGAKLGFSKLIVDQIQVGDIRDASGHAFWNKVFASEWDRNLHQFGARDTVYTVAVLAGLAIVLLAVLEMHFERRRDGLKPVGMIQFLIGLAGAIAGIVVLHVTDGVSGNVAGAAIIAVGALVGLTGFGAWRFEPISDRGAIQLTPGVVKFLGLGVGSLVLAYLASIIWDSSDATDLFFPFTNQGFRATLMLVFGLAGATALAIAASRARASGPLTRTAISVLISILLAVIAFVVRAQSESVKFRAEAFSVILVLALLVLVWGVMTSVFGERNKANPAADHLGGRMIAAGIVLVSIGMLTKLLFTVDAEIEAGIAPAKFSMRNVWFIVFTAAMVWVLGRTKFGSWTFAVGGNKEAARQVGVPAARTKTQLFMLVSGAAWLVGMLLAFRLNTIQANTGNGLEFNYIIAAVVGGTLLTGGYGTALGGAIGSIIVAMGTLGIPFARWNSDWQYLFLGVILLLAVIANRSIRTRAESMRR
jgi:ribose/xylose/arabinose/galactoside ABC-type transport system permease subunit